MRIERARLHIVRRKVRRVREPLAVRFLLQVESAHICSLIDIGPIGRERLILLGVLHRHIWLEQTRDQLVLLLLCIGRREESE